jgi:iron complex outermembrane recepter protein
MRMPGLRLFAFVMVLLMATHGAIASEVANKLSQEADFDIAPQALDAALLEFGKQADLQLMFAASDFGGKKTSGVQGRMSVEQALSALLRDSGLVYQEMGDKTVTVKPARGVAREGAADGVRLVRAETATGAADAGQENAGADDSQESASENLEEIVVTAQKRLERLQDVPISISVLRGEDLDRSTSKGLSELLNRVPGVSATGFSQPGVTQLAVRGVTAATDASSSPIGYYLDWAPFGLVKSTIVPDVNPYDLERVEVLRGPQGTLYGASAQNGVVRILTKDADLNEFDLKGRASMSSTDGGGGNSRADMAINVPIIEGKLGGRLVAGYENWSGWISKFKPNASDPTVNDFSPNANDSEIRNFRLKLNAQPVEDLSIGLSAWASRADFGAPAFAADGNTSTARLNEAGDSDFDVFGLKIGYDFVNFSVASMTSYLDYETNSTLDLFALGGILDPPGGFPLVTGVNSKVLTQEVNVNSSHEGLWRWSAGAIYRDGEDRFRQKLVFLPAPVDFYDRSESFAVFGQVTRVFLDGKLALTAGIRHFEDDVVDGENIRSTGIPTEPLYRRASTFNADSPRLALTWHPAVSTTVYASYAEGFRSGFNQNANASNVPPLEADTLKNYELGAKGVSRDGRIDYTAALYFIDWQDVQQTIAVLAPGTATAVNALINGESASGVGVEAVVSAEPVNDLRLSVGFNWNNLEMDRDVGSLDLLLFNAGDRLNLSPEYTANTAVSYEFPLGTGGLKGRLSASGNYISEQSVRFDNGGTLGLSTGNSIFTSRASFAVDSSDRWTATLFIENANNEDDAVTRNVFTPVWSTRIRPRTIGLQFEVNF